MRSRLAGSSKLATQGAKRIRVPRPDDFQKTLLGRSGSGRNARQFTPRGISSLGQLVALTYPTIFSVPGRKDRKNRSSRHMPAGDTQAAR